MSRDPSKNIRPFDVVVRACSEPRATFISSFRGAKLILVALGAADDGLVRGLLECPTDLDQCWYPRSESTGTKTEFVSLDFSRSEPSDGGPSTIRVSPRTKGAPTEEPPLLDDESLREILAVPHFVMPLSKRPQSETLDPEKITVGRSRHSDIVLYHPSVSKRHAFMEHDERERLYVCDRGSTNFTRVRGSMLAEAEVIPFSLGEPVVFGEIVTRVISPGILWEALNPERT